MRMRSIVAIVSVGAAAIVAGPFAQPASAGVTASSAGTAATVTLTGAESVSFRCTGGNLQIAASSGNFGVTPALSCASVTQVTVNGDGAAQQVSGQTLNDPVFAAGPKIIASLGDGGDFLSETKRADQVSMGPGDDWLDLTAGGAINGSMDLGSGTSDYLAVTGTSDPNSITALSTGGSASILVTYPSGSSTSTATNAERIKISAGAGNDSITTTGITAASSIDDGTLEGSAGDDTITDGVIRSYLFGGPGTNTLTGGDGQDSFWSESSTDTVNGSSDANTEWIYDTDGLRSGGRTVNGFTALDHYVVQAHQGDVTQRVRPAAGGASTITTSLTRTGQQVVPASLGYLTLGQAYAGSITHRGIADVVATDDDIGVTMPNNGTGILDVTVPSGTPVVNASSGNVLVTSSYGQVHGSNVDDYRVHGPWTNKNQGFAHRVTRDLMFRFASNAARDQIRDQLTSGTRTRPQVTASLMDTDEYRGLDVDRVFVKYLRRASDPGGRTYWINSLRSGKALWRFRAQLFGGNEYFSKAGGTNASYVKKAYNDVLGRDPDPSGQAYWTGKLDGGADRGSVALQFMNSPEARRRLVDDQFLRFLDRLPTSAEQSTWVARIPSDTGEQDLIAFLASSNAYFDRS